MAKIILTEVRGNVKVAKRIVDTNLMFKSVGKRTSVFADRWLFNAAESIEEVRDLINEAEAKQQFFVDNMLE